MKKAINKEGLKFGALTIIKEYHNDKKKLICECQCECGNVHNTTYGKLNIGHVKSCTSCAYKNKTNGIKSHKTNHLYKGYMDLSLTLFYRFKSSAERRNIPFAITIEEAFNQYIIQNKKCRYTDIELFLDSKNCNASLDRIDSSRGYTVDNIQWIYKIINIMKSNFDSDYFINLCRLINMNYLNVGDNNKSK